MHYPDLGTSSMIASGPRVRAVGWLAAGHEFTRGALDEPLALAVEHLAHEGWVHVAAVGPHLCEFCRRARDAANLLVPDSDVLYAAPAMIAHYMREHGYLPPEGFRAAVLRCPDPKTDAYYAELRRFVDVFSMSEEQFDQDARLHRTDLADRAAARAAARNRKGFTWD